MTPAVLGVSTYNILRASAFITFLVVRVTTADLNLESSRSFEIPINTRIPKHPALLTLLILIAFLIDFFVYFVYLGYEPEGSTFQYYSFFLLDYAIRTLSTLPRT